MARQYSLRDLVARTGFSPRQIRFYITERLVPGAGDDRGPHATYPQETLDRLLLIARFKAIPMPPANRTMTLEEIRHTLDGMSPQEIERQAQEKPILDHVGSLRVSMSLASEPLARLAPMDEYCLASPILRDEPEPGLDPTATEVRALLHRTERLLSDLARHRTPWRRTREDVWRCVKTPQLEIHVKQPVDDRERTHLRHLAESLSQLLGEESP